MDQACPHDASFAEFLEGTLTDRAAEQIRDHVDGCDACAELLTAMPAPQPGREPERLGRYVPVRVVGEGAMGLVYAAFDPELERLVAIKVQRDALPRDQAVVRLVKEAKATARLTHPNIVRVYDAGRLEDERAFVAMELVEGTTLRGRVGSGSPREVARMMLQAGAGLSAAHAAGIVHRDFKPDNVLVARDGRVLVSDFGLARLVAPTPATEAPADAPSSPPTVSRTDALAGTPAYMSPEQLAGRAADARSDQFAFAVTFVELVTGNRPFAGQSREPLRARPAGVPGWLWTPLARALSLAPDDRYPDMGTLLRDIRRGLGRRRRAAATALAALVVSGAVVAWAQPNPAATACPAPDDKIDRVWSDDVRGRIAKAASTDPNLVAVGEWTVRTLDDFVARWSTRHVEVCRDTRIHRELDEAALELRMGCLDRVLRRVGNLADMFAAHPENLERSGAAIGKLDLSVCDDVIALRNQQAARTPLELAFLDSFFEQQDALLDHIALGHIETVEPILGVLHAQAASGDFPALQAAAHELSAKVAGHNGDDEAQREALLAALWAVKRAGTVRDELRLAVQLIEHFVRRDAEQAKFWEQYAMALERRVDQPRMTASVSEGRALVAWTGGDYRRAEALLRRVLEIRSATLPADDLLLATAHLNLGILVAKLEGRTEAEDHYRAALRIRGAVYGPDHPLNASIWNSLGTLHLGEGEYRQAREWYRRALDGTIARYGESDPRVVPQLVNLGHAERGAGNTDAAMALFDRVLAAETTPGPSSVSALAGIATLNRIGDDLDAARAAAERAVELSETVNGSDHPRTASMLHELALILEKLERFEPALVAASRALHIREQQVGPDSPTTAADRIRVGTILTRQGKPERAVAELERAAAVETLSLSDRAEAEFALGQALWKLGSDRSRAIALVQSARDQLAQAENAANRVVEVEAWLHAHAPTARN